MKVWCLVVCVGILLASYLPDLPSLVVVASLTLVALLAWFCFRRFSLSTPFQLLSSLLLGFVLGIAYGVMAGHLLLSQQLPEYLAGEAIWVEGKVVGLPQVDPRRQLFEFEVDSARLGLILAPLPDFLPSKILLSSYGQLRVKTGERWRLQVKLKSARGFVNPGGFDYQASMLRRSLGATGYVRESIDNNLLAAQPHGDLQVLRYQLQQWLLQSSQSSEKAILIALLVGDTSQVSKEQWGELIKTGTNHLIAISGLHLGFFAIAGFLLGEFLGRFIQVIWHRYPASVLGHILALAFTLFYSLIAGMNIPTLRTLIMLAVVHIACITRRRFGISDVLVLALVCVMIYDPLAAFDIGFWLSFGAVALLLFCFSGRLRLGLGKRHVVASYAGEFIKSQWVMFIGLLIPLALLVNTSSLLAPAANFIAIPLITFFVVPCLILAALCQQVLGLDSTLFLRAAEWGVEINQCWLHYLLSGNLEQLNPVMSLNIWAVPLAVLGVFLLLLPQGISRRGLGVFSICLAFAIPVECQSPLSVLVFDVGQGTSVLIRTSHHQLLYDTGPSYTDHFDAGSGIIVPYLRSQGLRHLDALIVSHNDDDHSGGLSSILSSFNVDRLWLGEPEKYTPQNNQPTGENCHELPSWQWDEVSFHFIVWEPIPHAKANDRSCVLLVEYQAQKILLTGDIEKAVEQKLLAQASLSPVDILLAPHHGSHTSSTPGFVAETHPKYVIYSAGYRNQHGHPHKDVRARYQHINAIELNTAESGAIEFDWSDGQVALAEYRHAHRRYWFSNGQE